MARTTPFPPRQRDLRQRPPTPHAASMHKWMLALAVLAILAVWGFFSFDQQYSYLFGIVVVFFVMAIGVPWLIWRTGLRHPEAHPETAKADAEAASRHEDEGLADAIVPIAAVAIGLLVLAVVLHVVVRTTQ